MSIVNRARYVNSTYQASLLGRVLARYGKDKCDVFAASVAFTILFSMVPIILGVLVVVGLAISDPETRAKASDLVLGIMPTGSTNSIEDALSGISKNTRLFGLLTAFGVISAGTSLFRSLETAFNQVYNVPSRPFPRQVGLAIGQMLLFALLVYVQLASAGIMQFVGDFAGNLPFTGPWTAPLLGVTGAAVSLLMAFLFSLSIFYVVPNLRLPVRHTLPGAVLLSIGLVALTQVFPLYVRYLSGYNQYGAILGLFFILLTWAHLVADVLLLGAELNAELRPVVAESRPGMDKPPVRPAPARP